jgi:hypothetical protein
VRLRGNLRALSRDQVSVVLTLYFLDAPPEPNRAARREGPVGPRTDTVDAMEPRK